MFKDISKFQIIFLGLFVFFVVAGLAAFSLFKGSSSQTVHVTIWGTLDSRIVSPYFEKISSQTNGKMSVSYVQRNAATFDNDLLEALATGYSPDAIFVAQDSILNQANKILTIPYATISDSTFKTAFDQEGELFLTPSGVMAMPFSLDPMVMYWNRDIFTNANLSEPPKYWDEFLSLAPALTQRDAALNITQSAVALGEYANIDHAKDIVSLLMLQSGNPISVYADGGYRSTFSSTQNNALSTANSALTFYTQFANPLKSMYSWNRALPDSKTLFLANKLGLYFGYASELAEIKGKNPNLNFGVSYVPQLRPQSGKLVVNTTFGKLYGLAILKTSRSSQAAFNAISLITSSANAALWRQYSGLPTARRDAYIYDSSSAASAVFATSALWARGWLDPNDQATEMIFKNLIESITSGRSLPSDAISNADSQIRNLLEAVNSKN